MVLRIFCQWNFDLEGINTTFPRGGPSVAAPRRYRAHMLLRRRDTQPCVSGPNAFDPCALVKRASIEDFDMAARRRKSAKRPRAARRRRQFGSRARGVRMHGNKLRLKLGKSASSVVTIAPSALIRHVPISKLKTAARKALGKGFRRQKVNRRTRRRRRRTAKTTNHVF